MNNKPEPAAQELDLLLGTLETLAAKRVDASQRAVFRNFLRHYYEHASLDTLNLRTPEDLVDVAAAHFRLAAKRKAGDLQIEVGPPRDPQAAGSKGFAFVRTSVEDMPFLYDSVGMAVRDAGASIDWTVHPVLSVRRDGEGVMQGVTGAGEGERAGDESLIHIEFEALLRPEDYLA